MNEISGFRIVSREFPAAPGDTGTPDERAVDR
jgi:hypothetical protein